MEAAAALAAVDSQPLVPTVVHDDLGFARRRLRGLLWSVTLTAVLVFSMLVAVSVGPVSIPLETVWKVIAHHVFGWPGEVEWTRAQDNIVWEVRFPRVLIGAVVGASLAVCGVALQAMVRNVLADPYLLGISSGASTGAAAVLLLGLGTGFGANALSVAAFIGAMGASFVVLALARVGGRVTSTRLILAGVTIGYLLTALTGLMVFAAPAQGLRALAFFSLGSLTYSEWSFVAVPAAALAITLVALIAWARRLDALAIGDDTAQALGVSPGGFRVRVIVVVSLCIGVCVAVSGTIGFVGLVIPHLARRFVGAEHRRLLPIAALLGAITIVWSDVVSRLVFAPTELPVGIVTAVLGAPFLIILIHRFHDAQQ